MAKLWRFAIFGVAALLATPVFPQRIDDLNRDRARHMLRVIADETKKHYYDPKLKGMDFDRRVREADALIQKAASTDEALAAVAWALDILDDSHTFFLPPRLTVRVEPGWRMQIIGERCYVTAVKPKSDAEAKGLKSGDEIIAVNGYPPVREILWKMHYLHNILRPRGVLELQTRSVGEKPRQFEVLAEVRELSKVFDWTRGGGGELWDLVREIEDRRRLRRAREAALGKDLLIIKLPDFLLTDSRINSLVGEARNYNGMILDLRGNPGGSADALERFLGAFFEREVQVATPVARKSIKPFVAKPRGRNVFTGKLVVLVDSESGSAAELFARVVQLEKRGVVLGDRTAGSVVLARQHTFQTGQGYVVRFGAQITEADLIMSDGQSLEHKGVTPDETILPTPADLAQGRDPVLARAVEIMGAKLGAAEAGKLFPIEWPKQ